PRAWGRQRSHRAEHSNALASTIAWDGPRSRGPFCVSICSGSQDCEIETRTTMMWPALSSRMFRYLGLFVVTAMVLWCVPLVAHDMWIEPATFSPELGQIVSVRLRVGQDLL